jgi:hypothetical protein
MGSIVKYNTVDNTTGAPLTEALQTFGQNYEVRKMRRIFRAADIGTASGQTRDATNPTKGCLVAQFKGALIKEVDFDFYRATVATVTSFNTKLPHFSIDEDGVLIALTGWNAVYDAHTKISSLYIFDSAADAPTQVITADSWMVFKISLGNTP